MSDRNDRSFMRRQMKYQRKSPSTTPSNRSVDWEHRDEQLDDALRQTFPASDALSIVQSRRGS
jgi:hypothetical protein